MRDTRRNLLKRLGAAGATLAVGGTGSGAAQSTGLERVLLTPSDGVQDLLDALEAVDPDAVRTFENFDVVAAVIPSVAREILESDGRVAAVEDDEPISIPDPPTPIEDIIGGGDGPPVYDCETHRSQEPSWGRSRIGADRVETTGSGIDVAVLDTGIATRHCDLEVVDGVNVTDSGGADDYEDRNGHGTHCAGIVSALDDDVGVVGVAPEANLHAVKVLRDDGSGFMSWIAAGIDWCLSNDVELISMSVGAERGTPSLDAIIDDADRAGHLLVAAAGNDGNGQGGPCTEGNVAYPASHDAVLAVSAMDHDDSLASYSNVGPEIDVMAPGSAIESTYVDTPYEALSGTSMATPHVTGVAALVWSKTGDAPGANGAVRDTLLETTEAVLGTCGEGEGLIDAAAAAGEARPAEESIVDTLADYVPGFGVGGTLAALGGTSYLLKRRLDAAEDES